MILPPILSLKLNKAELALENGALELVKGNTNYFIEYFIENKKKKNDYNQMLLFPFRSNKIERKWKIKK